MHPNARSSAGYPRQEAALRQELRRLRRHALLAGNATPAERQRIAQLRDVIRRMDAERFAARAPVK